MLKEFGLSAEANKADEFWIDEAPKQSRMFGFQLQEEPVPLGKYLHDGDIITFGHTKLEAIHVPGHSPGSPVYYCKEENCMFSGDVLFQGSIGRADLSGRQLRRTDRSHLQPFIRTSQRDGRLPRTRCTNDHRNGEGRESIF